MGVTVPTMWNNMYISNMSEQQAKLIMCIRQTPEIPNLKGMLMDFPIDLIEKSLEQGLSIREIVKRDGIDYSPYYSNLRPYQTVGTGFMYYSPRSIIADGCGLGKTAEVSGLINLLKSKGEITRFLMAVEASAIGQTQYELMRFTGLNIVTFPSESYKLKKLLANFEWSKVDGIIIKHSTLRSDLFSQWLAMYLDEKGMSKIFNTFFLDESSIIKNSNTKMYKYTLNICNIMTRVHFMNATAFETSIMDIYNQLDMMDQSLLPKRWRIEKEYCTHRSKSYWIKENGRPVQKFSREFSGYKNQQRFKESLKLVYFGRSIRDIGKEVANVYKVYEVYPTPDMLIGIQQGHRYNEVLNCPSLISDLNIPMNRANVPKLDRLCSIIENEFPESPVMIYCFHIEAQKVIAEEMEKLGRKPVVLNGSCTDSERFEAQNGFNNGTYDVIITNIKKSLNLNAGSACIFYSMETNIAKMEQIRGRIDRHVDDSIKTFILLLYKATDEYEFFSNVVCKRAKDSRDLTIDAKTAADWFKESMADKE